jgi:hypothetical protein
MNVKTKKSRFLIVLSWTLIIGGGYTTLISILQNLALYFIAPDLVQSAADAAKAQKNPLFILFFGNMRVLFFVFLFASVLSTLSGYGLLKRKQWARFSVIFIMSALIFWTVLTVPLMLLTAVDTVIMMKSMQTLLILFGLVIVIGSGWIIKKLISDQVKRLFLDTSGEPKKKTNGKTNGVRS